MRFDRDRFAAAYVDKFPKPARTPQAIEGMNQLLANVAQDSAIEDLRWVAYMFATLKHECANRWTPIVEMGPRSYFDKYETGTAIGARLGNTQPGDGFRFRGRGYVQITGRRNYLVLGQKLNLADGLIQDPERALDPEIAYRIMSYGMRMGTFTGRKLGQFIGNGQCDYKNARKIINGLDRADVIAGYALGLEQVLTAALEQSARPQASPAAASPVAASVVPPVQPVEPVPKVASVDSPPWWKQLLSGFGSPSPAA